MPLTPNQASALKRQTSNLDAFEKKVWDGEYKGLDAARIKQAIMAPAKWDAFITRADEFLKQLTAYAADITKNDCPASDAAVKTWTRRCADYTKRLEEFKKLFTQKKADGAAMLDITQYKTYDSDLANIEGFAKAYTINGDLSKLAVETLTALEGDLKDNVAFVNTLPKTYAVIIKLGSAEGKRLATAHVAAVKAIQGYMKKQEAFIKGSATAGEKLLTEAEQRASSAKQNKQVAMFRQAENNLELTQQLIDRLATMDYKDAKATVATLTKRLASARKAVAAVKAAMKTELLESTAAPRDVYAGKDKTAIATAVTAAWKKKYPKDDILGLRFPNQDWVRDSIWRWSRADKAWYNNDTSVLRLNVIVNTGKETATIYQAYVNRDNTSDSLNIGVDTKGAQYVVEEMLVKNWK